ncbi:membrane-flanked domain protein [Xylanimonas cellulosilytica DSM 15894]|uniref:Membrane-flanked domain protein n=1 Tax=Xylanimonas cellulosilytica (strain DSM 15894 / JCM 12276 / CECT 5975 / KCTC 9989 / LMG 20990 / NBRC 107835 / XIL07) TaxID=446471 RepID=D1BZ88_XYLCX|nr:PH domain-containing protein [Xylanimonas cellulosilytica]ACZ31985.1 membrane-flanked domain protein [Xylanimonas cellulosilytica DSM 15894]
MSTPEPVAADLEWRRLHPVTPLVRGWTVVAVALLFVGQQSIEQFSAAGELNDAVTGLWWKILLGVVGLAAVAFGYAALAWRMTAYAIGDDSVYMRKGVLFRQQRRARLDRLQAVDIRQPVLARLFGLAELTLEVAGGSGSAVAIGFLKDEDARRLRAELLARAAGVRAAPHPVSEAPQPRVLPASDTPAGDDDAAGEGNAAGDGAAVAAAVVADAVVASPAGEAGPEEIVEAPEEQLYEVTPGLLVRSLVRTPVVWIVVAMIAGVVIAVVVTGQPSILVSAFPGLLAGGSYLFQRFTGEFGFRAALSPDGIRLRHGLLETRAQTIPPGRVQAVSLTQGPLWRGPDWWRVRVNVAGYGHEANGAQNQSVLLPVGTRADALTALWLVLPDLGVDDPLALLDEGLAGMVPAREGASDDVVRRFTNAPRRARWLDPLSWRRDAFAVTDRALLLRGGRLVRSLAVVPHERTQSLGISQGPLQRRFALASFAVHSTPGPVTAIVQHLAADDAARLLDEQAARARAARATAGPERWMERPEPAPTGGPVETFPEAGRAEEAP